MKAAAYLMMMWVRSSRTQMMTRKIMRHKVTYTVKVHGQGGARAVDPWWQGDLVLWGLIRYGDC